MDRREPGTSCISSTAVAPKLGSGGSGMARFATGRQVTDCTSLQTTADDLGKKLVPETLRLNEVVSAVSDGTERPSSQAQHSRNEVNHKNYRPSL